MGHRIFISLLLALCLWVAGECRLASDEGVSGEKWFVEWLPQHGWPRWIIVPHFSVVFRAEVGSLCEQARLDGRQIPSREPGAAWRRGRDSRMLQVNKTYIILHLPSSLFVSRYSAVCKAVDG